MADPPFNSRPTPQEIDVLNRSWRPDDLPVQARGRIVQPYVSPAVAVWPTDHAFPQTPEKDSFQERMQRASVGFSPDIGADRTRRRSSAVVFPTTAAFRITMAQRDVFERWFRYDLRDGEVPFQWPHPLTQILSWWLIVNDPQIEHMYFDGLRLTLEMMRFQ